LEERYYKLGTTNKPIRRNIAKISPAERKSYINAILKLNQKFFPGSKDDFRPKELGYKPPGHVSYWFKQDEIHQATHVHNGPAFLTWHRELCNRYEDMLQQVDDTVALHYWDWSTDPRASPDGNRGVVNLFSSEFMGSSNGRAGPPLDSLDNNGIVDGSRDKTTNPADPPSKITRLVRPGSPRILPDEITLKSGDDGPVEEQFMQMRQALEDSHGTAHGFIGGTLTSQHNAFQDPFVFLLHSNVDRLWASWQRKKGQEWRLDPNKVYGIEGDTQAQGHVVGLLTPLEPWAGIDAPGIEEDVMPARPWAPPENQMVIKNSKDISVVTPREYDEYIILNT